MSDAGDLHFQRRFVPPKRFDRGGLVLYVAFIAAFMVSTMDRDPDLYHFAKFSRELVKVEDFTRKYVESKARIVDALRKYPPQQSGATAVRITGPSTSSLTLA